MFKQETWRGVWVCEECESGGYKRAITFSVSLLFCFCEKCLSLLHSRDSAFPAFFLSPFFFCFLLLLSPWPFPFSFILFHSSFLSSLFLSINPATLRISIGMYPNPYQNNQQGGQQYPPPLGSGAPHQAYSPPTSAPPSMYPAPGGSPYQPQTAYQPPAAYPPHQPAAPGYPGGMMYPPPVPQPGAPPAGGAYPPPAQLPFSGMPSAVPTPIPTGGVPTSMPSPQQYGQQPTMPNVYPQLQPVQQQHSHGSMVPPFSPVQPSSPYGQPAYPPQPSNYQPPTVNPSSTYGFMCGPLLRYQNMDLHQGNWLGSVMMVSRPDPHGHQNPAPVLTWSDGRSPHPQHVTGQAIDGYNQSIFWRFALVIPQDPQVTKKITYSINGGATYWFFVAGRSESFRWMFYSCNGFSSATDSGNVLLLCFFVRQRCHLYFSCQSCCFFL